MSGPIVRKYGFPNFDKIFGRQELQHGVGDEKAAAPGTPEGQTAPAGEGEKKEEKGERKP